MKSALMLAAGVVSTVFVFSADAQIYQWKDAAGRTVISDSPAPGSVRNARTLGGSRPVVVNENDGAANAAPKTTAEKDLEFKKRQQDAREKSDKEAKEQAAARDKQENCERARRNLAVLEANAPVTSYNERGERELMGGAQREQEIERARQFIAETCK